MKLFFYYAFCSVKNQIRRLFKTWVAVFLLVCFALGAIIGIGASFAEDALNGEEDYGDVSTPEDTYEPSIFENLETEEVGRVTESAVAIVFIVMLSLNFVLADKSGASLFVMADVNLLFPAPIKPQTVTLFKLMTQILVVFFASIYFLIYIPDLFVTIGFGGFVVISLIFSWFIIIIYSKLLSVLVYSIVSTYEKLKSYLLPICVGAIFLISIFVGIAYLKSGDLYNSVIGVFSSRGARFIPILGWVKGLVACTIEGDVLGALIFLLLNLIALPLISFAIWHMRVDFYENAIEGAMKNTARIEAMKSGRAKKRDTDRADKLVRDKFNHGYGASVFFFRAMYNRARFSFLKFFTKTSVTYILLLAGTAVVLRIFSDIKSFLPIGIILCAIAFWRAIGNPIGEDAETCFFYIVPASAHAKVFYSLLAGSVTTALDALPGVVLSVLIIGASPIEALVFYALCIAIDLYSSSVMLFITLSLPSAISFQIKQVITIMFIYFGLLPIAAIIIIGAVLEMLLLFILLAALFAFFIGAVVYAFSPLFIENGRK